MKTYPHSSPNPHPRVVNAMCLALLIALYVKIHLKSGSVQAVKIARKLQWTCMFRPQKFGARIINPLFSRIEYFTYLAKTVTSELKL